ncbi:zinc finger protein ZFP69 [Lingula anatina]|uniref:Zinc finger protein ZFP69 n=1 Tax=Lingula anatina TaxID=7574 RepID=A0A1S3K2F1_LINAN|nr:zinc finger protein ZFP69 [Lingula anatina]XP_013416815.1 zinc finger protein ZFP69 [Lingula anatina]XP_013416822.1 zinc finger protein ZFP69 [Lingula anatina]|eukprot:XP_013416806.1 zinc finger protein ZFP69 [Lingula anatina]
MDEVWGKECQNIDLKDGDVKLRKTDDDTENQRVPEAHNVTCPVKRKPGRPRKKRRGCPGGPRKNRAPIIIRTLPEEVYLLDRKTRSYETVRIGSQIDRWHALKNHLLMGQGTKIQDEDVAKILLDSFYECGRHHSDQGGIAARQLVVYMQQHDSNSTDNTGQDMAVSTMKQQASCMKFIDTREQGEASHDNSVDQYTNDVIIQNIENRSNTEAIGQLEASKEYTIDNDSTDTRGQLKARKDYTIEKDNTNTRGQLEARKDNTNGLDNTDTRGQLKARKNNTIGVDNTDTRGQLEARSDKPFGQNYGNSGVCGLLSQGNCCGQDTSELNLLKTFCVDHDSIIRIHIPFQTQEIKSEPNKDLFDKGSACIENTKKTIIQNKTTLSPMNLIDDEINSSEEAMSEESDDHSMKDDDDDDDDLYVPSDEELETDDDEVSMSGEESDDPYKPGDEGYQQGKRNCGKFISKTKKIFKKHQEGHRKHRKMAAKQNGEKNKMHTCKDCDLSFPMLSGLRDHKKAHSFKCSYCEKEFKSKRSFRTHEKTHPEARNFLCRYCGKNFTLSQSWRWHEKNHVKILPPEKTYLCHLCGKDFVRGVYLQRHIRLHTGEKPFQCKTCTKSFAAPGALHRHSLIHRGEKRHQCNFCEKRFVQKGACTRHMRVHTGEKPYKCHYCDEAFSHNVSRKTHEKLHKKCEEEFSV